MIQTNAAVSVNVLEQPTIECSNCKGKLFIPAYVLKRIRGILIGSPEDAISPIQIYVCAECGEICKEGFPEGFINTILTETPKQSEHTGGIIQSY